MSITLKPFANVVKSIDIYFIFVKMDKQYDSYL